MKPTIPWRFAGLALTLVATVACGQNPPPPAQDGVWAVSFHSAALGRNLDYLVALPADYETATSSRYPVLYLLHGRGNNMQAWARIATELRRLATEGRIPPVIAIMPDASSNRRAGYYIDSKFTGSQIPPLPAGENVETAFTRDLVVHVDATYRTRADRTRRIVAGYSMGGYGAMRYALVHPELFGAAIVLSPAVYFPLPPPDSSTREFGAFGRGAQLFDEAIYTAKNYPAVIPAYVTTGRPLVMFIAVGDDERALADPAQASHDLDYEAHTLYNHIRRVPLITAELRVVNGPHDWATWRPMFVEGVQFVFRQLDQTAAKPR